MGENRSYSTRQIAEELGVSVQTVQRWVDSGRLKAWKTPGGHRKIDAASADELIRAMRSGHGRFASEAGARVLIVDDDPAALQLVELLVAEALPDARIGKARNGFEALQSMGRETPDVLVTDIVMPHIDGLQMLRHVAAQASRPDLVIVTSILGRGEIERRGVLPGDVVVLPKPLDQAAFVALLRSRVAGR